jgi:NhaA family Na+:H+ antiporter
MHGLERALHPWVTYAILPLFALANAGVPLSGNGLVPSLLHPVGLGVLAGLAVGKQVGITLATWVAVRVGLATLPDGLGWRHVYGAAWLGGIGFTMSIFIAGLAFGGTPLLDTAKLAIFAASICSGGVGWAILRGACPQPARLRPTIARDG